MAYIPKEHEKYDILPSSRGRDWEVFEYDSELLFEIHKEEDDFPDPYGFESYDAYYAVIDDYMVKRPDIKDLLLKYKTHLQIMNDKSKWGIVRYIGESNFSFTKGRCYYVPVYELNGKTIVSGVIDDEEYTSYCGWDFSGKPIDTTETEDGIIINEEVVFTVPKFEIIVNPGGALTKGFADMK